MLDLGVGCCRQQAPISFSLSPIVIYSARGGATFFALHPWLWTGNQIEAIVVLHLWPLLMAGSLLPHFGLLIRLAWEQDQPFSLQA